MAKNIGKFDLAGCLVNTIHSCDMRDPSFTAREPGDLYDELQSLNSHINLCLPIEDAALILAEEGRKAGPDECAG